MKKIILFIVILAALPLHAATVYIAPQIELGAGLGDFYEDYELNPGLGPGLLLGVGVTSQVSFEGEVQFIYWFADEPGYLDITYYEIPFYLGVNFRLNDTVGITGGMGGVYQYYRTEVDLGFVSPHTDRSETNFSFFAGLDICLNRIIFRPKFVWIDSGIDTYSLQLAVGYKIGM
jgi:hypothetical protein